METEPRKHVVLPSSFFPVDESLLPRLNISPAQHEELRDYAFQAAQDTIRDGPTWGRSNIESAVASGWKVLTARPTACFMTKKQSKKKQSKRTKKTAARGEVERQQQQRDDKRAVPPTPRVTSLGSFHGIDIVRNVLPSQPSAASVPLEAASGQHFMAHAVLPNSLEDVMNALYCEETSEMRALKQKAYGEAALDCCVLQTLESATLEDPFWYLGLKWLALRSPIQALMASREFVYLEHLGTHVDAETGRRMLYRVIQSVHIRGYGGQDSYFGLTRGNVEAAFVYWMDDEDEVRNPLLHVCAKGRIHMKGSMPDTLVYRYLKSIWRSERSLFPANRMAESSLGMSVINDSADQTPVKTSKKKKSRRRRVPSGQPLEMAHEWVADELRSSCSVCNKKFRLVKRFKHHCRACGEVMCHECTFQHRVNVRAVQSFRSLKGTVVPGAASADRTADTAAVKHKELSTDFEETMSCSFDNQVVGNDSKGGSFDASLSLMNARKAVNGSVETAVLGGDSVVCVVMAKVCLWCLQSAPLANKTKSKATLRRRHSEMAIKKGVPASNTDGELGLDGGLPLRPQSWTPDYMRIEELDEQNGAQCQTSGRELDVPMLVLDDTDAESDDGLAETKKHAGSCVFDERSRPSVLVGAGTYAQEWYGEESGGVDQNTNDGCVVNLPSRILSTSSSSSSSKMYEFMEEDDYVGSSSGRYSSQCSIDTFDDNNSIQFYPTQTNQVQDDEELKPAAKLGRRPDLNSSFEHTESELFAARAAAAKATVSATQKGLRAKHDPQEGTIYQNGRTPPSTASSTSIHSMENADKRNDFDGPIQDLYEAVAVVKSSIAGQARILDTIKQERKNEAPAMATISLCSWSFV
uniref:FYVE-type domain-containing protein n=1 Tax=Hyaloperonospora arabidopsidis (strain Emoy2) TaxID=559515 RepID=M4B8A3_HYAAE